MLLLSLASAAPAGAGQPPAPAATEPALLERRLELLRLLKPDDWRLYVDERGALTPEGARLVDDYLAASAVKPAADQGLPRARRAIDRLFAGGFAEKSKGSDDGLIVDARLRNETVYDMTVASPKTGLAFSAGQLYVDDRHPLAAASPYANLTWGTDSRPDDGVDYRVKASLGRVGLRSRYFSDGPPPGVDSALQLGRELGVAQDQLDPISRSAADGDRYQTHGIFVSSLLAELGRAQRLAGPVDASWTLGGLVKTLWAAPNAAFDETLGLRARLRDGLSAGLFGGVAQNVSPVGDRILQEALDGPVKTGVFLESAPHVGTALWGKVPGASGLDFSASTTHRWTAQTQVNEGESTLTAKVKDRPLSLKIAYSRESGPNIGFDREKASPEIAYGFADGAQGSLSYQRDHIRYGNVQVDSDSFLAGVRIAFGPHHLAVDQSLSGRYSDHSPRDPRFREQLAQIRGDLLSELDAWSRVNQAYQNLRSDSDDAQRESRLNELSLALSRLSLVQADALVGQLDLTPEQKAELGNVWLKTVSPSNPYYARLSSLLTADQKAAQDRALAKIDDWSQYYSAHEGEIRRVLGLLTDERILEAAMIATARAKLIAAGNVAVPILGDSFTLTIDAPAVLATAGILHSRLSPPIPLQPGQADAWLMRAAGKQLGLSGTPTSQQVAAALLDRADQQIKQQLERDIEPLLKRIGDPASSQALASEVLSSVPPDVAALLTRSYGPDLAGLIPPGLSGQPLKEFVDNQLPERIAALLERRYGARLAADIARAVSWAGDLYSREVNATLIQLLLASEELDRLSVDRGEKIDVLDRRMTLRSFDALDARGGSR